MSKDLQRALLLWAGLMAAFTVFNLFDDKPRAFYHSQALLGCALMIVWGRRASRRMAGVCAYGLFLYGSTVACDLSYSKESNGWQYVCDAGTGTMVSAITLAAGVLIAAWLLRVRDG